MTNKSPAKLLAEALVLSDEINKLIRRCVGESDLAEVEAALSMAGNRSDLLRHLCKKIRRAIKNGK